MPAAVRFVLVRPQHPENAGAAARAMKNFGLSDWAWVAPEFTDLIPARRLAVHATELLERVPRFQTVEEAVADCVWVVGTSSRTREGKRRMGPRAFAREALARAEGGPVALVFGGEQSGLSNAEIDLCHDLCGVPTDDGQPSINLAQAVLLFAYELRMAALERTPPPEPPLARPASAEALWALQRALEEGLSAARFLSHPERHAVRDLFATLTRARLSRREAELWNAALRGWAKAIPPTGG
jgi:tRNA/rRNA methyltransferase/tRNA (cytidine32/uridine32-2'-O)-methyltransferase